MTDRKWTELDTNQHRTHAMRLLDGLEVTAREKRLKVARAILYVAQGTEWTPSTPDASFSDAAQSDVGRGTASCVLCLLPRIRCRQGRSHALCLLPSQMRAGVQQALSCVCCLVRCRQRRSHALCLLPGQMWAGAQRAVPCICRHLWGVQLRGRGSVLDALQHLSALGGGHLQRSGGAFEHGNRVSSSEGLK